MLISPLALLGLPTQLLLTWAVLPSSEQNLRFVHLLGFLVGDEHVASRICLLLCNLQKPLSICPLLTAPFPCTPLARSRSGVFMYVSPCYGLEAQEINVCAQPIMSS